MGPHVGLLTRMYPLYLRDLSQFTRLLPARRGRELAGELTGRYTEETLPGDVIQRFDTRALSSAGS
jgi:hypothetical protein